MKKYLVYVFVVGCMEDLNFKGNECIGAVRAENDTDALRKAEELAGARGIEIHTIYTVLDEDRDNETPWGESHSAF
jgi:hypothetical protein